MSNVILCCSCFNMSKRASQAFTLLHPDMVLPEIIKGRDRVHKFAEQTRNEHIKAISKLTGKYAYYIEMDGDKITKEENLLTGARIA